jgi:hypothetical protein
MPLLSGSSSSVVSANIRELRNSGRPEAQSVAIAMRKAGKAKPKKSKKPAKMSPLSNPGEKLSQ